MNIISFIHISDLHFENNYEGKFIERLSALTNMTITDQIIVGLREIVNAHENIDFVLLTGDITHHGSIDDYACLRTIIDEELGGIPVFIALGNHDEDKFYGGYLGISSAMSNDEKRKENSHKSYYYSFNFNGLRIISLDSRGGKNESGFIDREQLDWLRKELESESEKGTILILHHTPHISGENETLSYQMENPNDLYEAIKDSDVKAIFAGHTHKAFASMLGKIPCYTVDSLSYGIDLFMDRMEINNRTGYNYCEIADTGNLAVRHIPITREEDKKATVRYYEMMKTKT